MRVYLHHWVFAVGFMIGATGAALAQVKDQPIDHESVVYIECSDPKDPEKTTAGTGVVVSEEGHVLTAKHVVPESYTCRGAKGSRARLPIHYMIERRRSPQDHHDVLMLQFVEDPNETFRPVRYVELDKTMQGFSISAFGFPDKHRGEPERRTGTIGSTFPDERGFIGASAETVKGMSGGPVVLDTGELIGIVAGSDYDKGTGEVTRYALLVAEEFAPDFPNLKLSTLRSVTETPHAEGSGNEVTDKALPPDMRRLISEAIAQELEAQRMASAKAPNPASAAGATSDAPPSPERVGEEGIEADPTAYPARAVAKVIFQRNGNTFTCSGAIVSESFMITARYCLFDGDAKENEFGLVRVVPGYSNGNAPFGLCGATRTFAWPSRGELDGSANGFAGVQLDCKVGRHTGYLGLASEGLASGQPIRLFGYTAGANLVSYEVQVADVDAETIKFVGLDGPVPGSGGGPLLASDNNVVGIYIGTSSDPMQGLAVRLTAERIRLIQSWIAEGEASSVAGVDDPKP